jgi:hypothetical protein
MLMHPSTMAWVTFKFLPLVTEVGVGFVVEVVMLLLSKIDQIMLDLRRDNKMVSLYHITTRRA